MWPAKSNWVPANVTKQNYRYATQEVRRVDMHKLKTIPDLSEDALTYARNLGEAGGPYDRRHSIEERLESYVNKLSKHGTYVEVLPEELPELKNVAKLMAKPDLRVVEIGFNRDEQVCKVGLTVSLSTERVAFLCVGMDGGLKTMYVTPEFKWRKKYMYSDSKYNNKKIQK